MEIWAGIECTVNRVGDQFYDQLKTSGHYSRPEDIDLIHDLGIRTIRYPFLWEYMAPEDPHVFDWTWADERIAKIKSLGINPIAGLLHHGSGPFYSSLIDPHFPAHFAHYAGAFARRYPWLTDYTPINEPLTTARFSGLYGHWYPHGRDEFTFLTALIHQCRGIQLAMQSIRKTNPAARLVQTEDMGKYWSVPGLESSAEFLNLRRWLSLDLLCGRVDQHHPLQHYLLANGISNVQLDIFLESPCVPDIIGVNYYVVSERLIDHVYTEYPPGVRGDYEQHGYIDIEAVRTQTRIDPGAVFKEIWERYGLPIAVTEAHLNCTREEQMRWFMEIWHTAMECQKNGMDIRAVTAWSAFGAYNWDKLLTCTDGCYETGLYDLHSHLPRPTALAEMVKTLAAGQEFRHAALAQPGWWRREERILYERSAVPLHSDNFVEASHPVINGQPRRPILIIGDHHAINDALGEACDVRAIEYAIIPADALDINYAGLILLEYNPWAVIYTADYEQSNPAAYDPAKCHHINVLLPTGLAAASKHYGCQFLSFSSARVFGDPAKNPNVESAVPTPADTYGQSKANGERCILDAFPEALVLRAGLLFGSWSEHDLVRVILKRLARQQAFQLNDNRKISLTYIPDLVLIALDLLIDRTSGVWHLANRGSYSMAQLGKKIAALGGFDAQLIMAAAPMNMLQNNRYPLCALSSERGQLMPAIDQALACYLQLQEAVIDKVGFR